MPKIGFKTIGKVGERLIGPLLKLASDFSYKTKKTMEEIAMAEAARTQKRLAVRC